MTVTLYGIKNCDTVRAARKWLEQHHIEHGFHDVRDQPLSAEQLLQWHQQLGDALINRRSTTWKQLNDSERSQADDNPAALLRQHPTLMKRPLLDTGSALHLGFKAADYQQLFSQHTL